MAEKEKVNPILTEIEKIMQQFKGQSSFKITMDTRLDGLGLDSLDTVTMMMEIEDKLGVTIELNKETINVGDIIKIIEAQKKAAKK